MTAGVRGDLKRGAVRPYALRVRLFKLRVLLFALPLLFLIAYYRWIAPWFGAGHVQRLRLAVPRALSRAFLRVNGIGIRLRGEEHLAARSERPRLLMVNHNSRFDGYLLLAIMDEPFKSFWSNTAHVTTERFSLIQAFGRTFDLFFVHDKSDKRRTLQEFRRAEAYLSGGATLSLFPEGTFSGDGEIRGFGSSCVSLAIRTGADIIPVVMAGSEATFEKQWRGDGPVEVQISVLPAVSTAGAGKQDVARLLSDLEMLMNVELRRMRMGECQS